MEARVTRASERGLVREYKPERNVLGDIDDAPHKWGRTAASIPGVPGTGEHTRLQQPHRFLQSKPSPSYQTPSRRIHNPPYTHPATTSHAINLRQRPGSPCLTNPCPSLARAGERNVLSFLSPDSGYDR